MVYLRRFYDNSMTNLLPGLIQAEYLADPVVIENYLPRDPDC